MRPLINCSWPLLQAAARGEGPPRRRPRRGPLLWLFSWVMWLLLVFSSMAFRILRIHSASLANSFSGRWLFGFAACGDCSGFGFLPPPPSQLLPASSASPVFTAIKMHNAHNFSIIIAGPTKAEEVRLGEVLWQEEAFLFPKAFLCGLLGHGAHGPTQRHIWPRRDKTFWMLLHNSCRMARHCAWAELAQTPMLKQRKSVPPPEVVKRAAGRGRERNS